MTTDIELSTPQQRFLPTPVESERVWKLAQTIAQTDFVPRGLRGNVHAITAAMLTGREIGIGPMHSLRAIDVIDGKPSLSAELMASLVLRAGHWLWVVQSDHEACTVAGRRREWPDRIPDQEVTWTIADATLAGLLDPKCEPAAGVHDVHDVRRKRQGGWVTEQGCGCKENWRRYPRAMLRARATSELARAVFSDVVERVGYVAEELGSDEPSDHAEQVEGVRDVAGDEVADTVDATFAEDQDGEDQDEPGEVTGDTTEPEVWDVDAEPDPPAADDLPFDWKAYAAEQGVKVVPLLTALRADWPANSQWNKPNRSADIDALAADGTMAPIVKATIDDLAGGR